MAANPAPPNLRVAATATPWNRDETIGDWETSKTRKSEIGKPRGCGTQRLGGFGNEEFGDWETSDMRKFRDWETSEMRNSEIGRPDKGGGERGEGGRGERGRGRGEACTTPTLPNARKVLRIVNLSTEP